MSTRSEVGLAVVEVREALPIRGPAGEGWEVDSLSDFVHSVISSGAEHLREQPRQGPKAPSRPAVLPT